MFSLFKKKPAPVDVPGWASFFNPAEYAVFISALDHFFKKLKIPYKMDDGQIHVEESDFGFNRLGLTNVAQVCKQNPTKSYGKIISEHFNAMISANKFEKKFAKIADNFSEASGYLAVRLYPEHHIAPIGKENTIGQSFAGDVYAMLVFDFPESVMNVKPEQIKIWNKTPEELFEIGIANIKAKYKMTILKQKFGEFWVWFVHGDHFFVPNIVFDLENRPNLIGSRGALIGIPHRHAAIIYPIETFEVVEVLNRLIFTIYGMNQEGPGSLSNNLFWYKDKTFTALPYKLEDESFKFYPPTDFIETCLTE